LILDFMSKLITGSQHLLLDQLLRVGSRRSIG